MSLELKAIEVEKKPFTFPERAHSARLVYSSGIRAVYEIPPSRRTILYGEYMNRYYDDEEDMEKVKYEGGINSYSLPLPYVQFMISSYTTTSIRLDTATCSPAPATPSSPLMKLPLPNLGEGAEVCSPNKTYGNPYDSKMPKADTPDGVSILLSEFFQGVFNKDYGLGYNAIICSVLAEDFIDFEETSDDWLDSEDAEEEYVSFLNQWEKQSDNSYKSWIYNSAFVNAEYLCNPQSTAPRTINQYAWLGDGGVRSSDNPEDFPSKLSA